MLQTLRYEDFALLAQTAHRLAIFQEIQADRLTPIQIVESLGELMQDGMILESGIHSATQGRYSLIAFGQIAQLRYQQGRTTQTLGGVTTTLPGAESPFTLLRQLLKQFACANKPETEHFIPSAMGLITYDAVRLLEDIPDRHAPTALPDVVFNFYQTTLLFDHVKQTLLIQVAMEVNSEPRYIYQIAKNQINYIIDKIHTPVTKQNKPFNPTVADTTVTPDDDTYQKMVAQAKQHISAGDAFQIVLSRCFKQAYTISPFEIYRTLRHVSPAPYMFYIPVDDSVIVGASPEKLVSVRHGKVAVNPIAGTRPRLTDKEDTQIAAELLHDPKELAEHMMLVDLARNDVGAVSKPGSVAVSDLLTVKHFSHISHITSTVTGELREDKDALDAFAATFPAGTLSGAPKIRAMQIIDALEDSKRGIYGGAICHLDDAGNFDSCIAIRTAILHNGTATIRTGAGIVFDSIPQQEADETRHKANAILTAIRLAETGDL